SNIASQGKTRPYNPVNLNNCRTHQSYYTALSRATTADGMLILPAIGYARMLPIDPNKIRGGCSGRLRQEFRELEMLDDITRRWYDGVLPITVTGDTRYLLIQSYMSHVGLHYSPPNMDTALVWSTVQPFDMTDATVLTWKKTLIPHKPVALTPMKPPKKRKGRASDTFDDKQSHPDKRVHEQSQGTEGPSPMGCRWSHNSCAYDAVIFILFNTWNSSRGEHGVDFAELGNKWLDLATACFERFTRHEYTLEQVRDYLRRALHRDYPSEFVFSQNTSVEALMMRLLRSASVFTTTEHKCRHGHCDNVVKQHCCVVLPYTTGTLSWNTHQQFFDNTLSVPSRIRCNTCMIELCITTTYNVAPPLFAIDVASTSVLPDHSIRLTVGTGTADYRITGIVYYGASHFTARYMDADRTVWFNDGLVHGRRACREGSISEIDLGHDPSGKEIASYIYLRTGPITSRSNANVLASH
ncbi:hypothetical protein IW262DRAFT_1276804, partial [Armillaria fumosa]